MNKVLREQFNALRQADGHINPDAVWVDRTRETLLAQIARTEHETVSSSQHSAVSTFVSRFVPLQMFAHARPIFVSLLVFLLAASGWMTSASASGSLPGDALWKVKLAGEKTQAVLANITGNDTKHVELQLKFAARRAEEIKTISHEETFDKAEKVKRTEEGLVKLQENISSVGEAVKEAQRSDEQKKEISQKAQVVNDTTSQISDTLKEVADIVQDEGAKNDTFTKNVVAIKQTVDDVGLDVVKTAVESATNDTERSVAAALVEQKIVSVLSEADGTLNKSAEVKTLIGQVDTKADASKALGALQTMPGVVVSVSSTTQSGAVPASSTTAVSASSTGDGAQGTAVAPAVVPSTKDVISSILGEVDRTSQTVQDRIAEIKALIEAGNLTGALEKAKELKRITNDSAQKTNEIQKVVERVVSDQKATAVDAPTSTPPVVPATTTGGVVASTTVSTPPKSTQ